MHVLLRKILLISLVVLYAPVSQSELIIEITKGTETAVPIAVVPFGGSGRSSGVAVNISSVVQADLNRSGYFKTLTERDMLSKPTDASKVRFRNWQALGQEYLVIGQVNEVAGRYQIQFQLFDVYKGQQLLGYRLNVAESELRRTAHHISDLVYQKLTGKKGVFSTRIAYVTSTGKQNNKRYKLLVADADGFNPRTIASSKEPLMSPSWSPDGKKLAYVSFENKRAAIYIQILATGKREKIAAYKGINGAPAFSPDGSRLALTLSKDGSPDIYVLNLKNKFLTKVTKSYGIDTEPTWSPDGKNIVYTSDRGGKPQLYSIPSTGGQARRITFAGDYNARGRFSPDGRSIAMVHANRGDYRIAVMDMATRTINVLTAGRYDESPSFSPNGDMILYAARKGKRGVLSAVSIDGRMQQNLAFDSGEVREPAWSP
jgi:TolB protein